MANVSKDKALVQLRMDRADKEEFDRLCDEQSINKSDLIRRLILDWVKEQKAGK